MLFLLGANSYIRIVLFVARIATLRLFLLFY